MIKLIFSILVILNISNIIYLDALSNITWEQLNLGYYTNGISSSILTTSIIDVIGLLSIYAISNNNLAGLKDQLIMIPKAYFVSLFIMFVSIGEVSMIGSRLLGSSIIPMQSIELFSSHIYIMIATFLYSVFTSNIMHYGREIFVFVAKYVILAVITLSIIYFASDLFYPDISRYMESIKNYSSFNLMKSTLLESKYALYTIGAIFSLYIIIKKIFKFG